MPFQKSRFETKALLDCVERCLAMNAFERTAICELGQAFRALGLPDGRGARRREPCL